MTEVRTATFVLYDNPHNGDRVQAVVSGDEGQGERLIEDIEDRGHQIIEIVACDVSGITPNSALWLTGVLGPRPSTVRALGSVAGGSSFH
jgi:hypothetical protein